MLDLPGVSELKWLICELRHCDSTMQMPIPVILMVSDAVLTSLVSGFVSSRL